MELTGASFVLPDAWLEHVHPRRGGAGVRPFTADRRARARTDRLLPSRPGGVAGVLAAPSTPDDVRAAAEQWAAGHATPVGAAAVAVIRASGRNDRGVDPAMFADLWIGEHGLVFAAVAAVQMASLVLIDDNAGAGQQRYPSSDLGVRFLRSGESPESSMTVPSVLLRVRAALAVATDDEFEQVVAALTPFRAGLPHARAACSVLVPRPDWVAADVADALADRCTVRARMLLYATSDPRQARQLAEIPEPWSIHVDRSLVFTLLAAVGPEVVSTLYYWLDQRVVQFSGAGTERWLFSVVAAIPRDDVLTWLLARADDSRAGKAALLEAAERFPGRALRVLAEQDATDLLRVHVVRHVDLVDEVVPQLSPAAAGRVRAIVDSWAAVVTAPASAVPPVLADPPWRSRKKAAKPPVVAGLTCSDPAAVSWLPGEREGWAQGDGYHVAAGTDWAAMAERALGGGGRRRWDEPGKLFCRGPEEIARETLARWKPHAEWNTPSWLPTVAVRFGTGVLPALLTLARTAPADYAALLMPFTSPEVAVLMADWSARLKSVRSIAQGWLLRHPAPAARALIPAALGKAGLARRQAERALLLLHGNGHTALLRQTAEGFGPEAAAGVEALFTADPLLALPARMPNPPVWAAPGALPPVRLRDGSGALPAEAVTHLVQMLMISRSDEPYAGLALVREAITPAEFAEFGWALFHQWQTAGAPAKDGWVLDAVALTGTDEIADRLAPLILAWPSEGLHARAIAGLSVLGGIGTDGALMHLHRISQRAKSTPLRKAAAARISAVAEGLGLTSEELADRLIPDFGLDSDGSLRLDYGPRQFVVGFDEQLRPFVTGGDGKPLKELPKPGVRDDAEPAAAAYQRFAVLKRAVRKISADQVRRLEEAMVAERRWSGADFRRLFVEHPLMWHIGRRLLWARFDETGAVAGALRIAEDRSFAGADDEPVRLGDDDVVGVAHPLHLGEDAARWAEVFADYEVLQPFPQVGRPVFALTEAERATGRLARFEGVTVPTTKVLTLDRRGWVRHEAVNAGIQAGFDRLVGPGRVLTVHIDPGIVGKVGYHAKQSLVAVFLHDGSVSPWDLTGAKTLPFGVLDPIAASEILRDLTDVTA
ncbi:DUF4132 domain-containing protein [Actinoplanes sichuanensis]|uniref:DUF4132 domain-containing protein n=1 Tax=Actinoplanes sichuanensis TaxID=512349 RepID=A0ABW4ANK1_9ACTN|nr:DUF4132 domain-containing protein [Actinoplanes sichuanensis]